MKIFILSFVLFTHNLYAISPAEISALKKGGMDVILGELTGAGSKMSIVKLEGIIHRDEISLKNSIRKIKATKNINPMISDIESITTQNGEIFANEIEGIIIRN